MSETLEDPENHVPPVRIPVVEKLSPEAVHIIEGLEAAHRERVVELRHEYEERTAELVFEYSRLFGAQLQKMFLRGLLVGYVTAGAVLYLFMS